MGKATDRGVEPVVPPGWRPRDEDLDFFGLTHPGLVRKQNQDHFLFSTLHKTMRVGGTSLPNPELIELPSQRLASFGMVADGVGGREGGEVASRAAVETIASYATGTLRSFYEVNQREEGALLAALKEGAVAAHRAVLDRAAASGDGGGIATTLTAIMAIWPDLYVLQVGDSRCYQHRQGRLMQLTRDQTMAQELVDAGAMPPDRAAESRFAHILSSSIGGRQSQPVVTRHGLEPRDVILLCSDGLTKHVTDEQIGHRLAHLTSSASACQLLLEDALAGGGSDDVTVVVLRAIAPA